MKCLHLLLLTVLLCSAARAQRFLTEVFPSFSKTTVQYASNFTIITGSPTSQNLMCDVYQPAGITDTMARRPLIIMLHAGSFLPAYVNGQLQGSRVDSGLEYMCKSFARRGYVVANIDYRLGWAPTNASLDVRRGTIIQAAYRAVQDVKCAVRFFRKDAATANAYMIDSNRVIVGGEYTGGLIAVNYAALTSQAQIAIPKFISNITAGGYIAGLPYIRDSLMGDLDGYGGNPALNNATNSVGYNGKANFVFAFEAVVGDTSWITPGLPPMVSLHRINNTQNSPYGYGVIYVFNPPNPPLSVVDVAGSNIFIARTNSKGNNASFNPNTFTDVYTMRANSLNGGQDGLFPLVNDTAAIVWYDSVASVSECLGAGVPLAQCTAVYNSDAAGHTKAKSLTYIDTLMGYVNPRIVQSLNLAKSTGVQGPYLYNGIAVFPNPSAGDITVSATKGIESVTIRDISGKTIRKQAANKEQSVKVHLSAIPAGMYLITVQSADAVVTRRLVLQ